MIRVIEIKKGNEIVYKKQIVKEGKVLNEELIGWKVVSIGKEYFLYDSNYIPSLNSYEFLSSISAVNSRRTAAHALKVLFSFQNIVGKNIVDFKKNEMRSLVEFLLGRIDSGKYVFKNLTARKNETVNMYLSVYRKYLAHYGVKNAYLSEKYAILLRELDKTEFANEGYKLNVKSTQSAEVPKYISVEEFSKILSIVRKKYSVREEIIIRLMYEGALRIGEVLGLTNEDIRLVEQDGVYSPIVYIRNRATDRHYQHAKTCMDTPTADFYNEPAYCTKPVGYQFIPISFELYELICDYIEEAHCDAYKRRKTKYKKSTYADAVVDTQNFYIWLNDSGTLLSSQTWNDILRGIYKEAGIKLDHGKRKSNLNHRFRHGFAIFQVKYMKREAVELTDLMRHKSIMSTLIYYSPTITDKVELKTEFTEDLYQLVPALKRRDR